MPDVNVKGRYLIYTHDGTEPLLFTSYSSSLCSIRRPNPNTFITISTYIPGSLSPFTTFDPGSSYTIVTRSNEANFSIGPYVRADRLPSSVTFRSPNFYHGLDNNSITVALSSYALSFNSPLSTAFTYIPDQNGYYVNSISFDTERFKQGLPSLLNHLKPGTSYQFKTRVPFTFFAPLQSEMGDTFAAGYNSYGSLSMGHQQRIGSFWENSTPYDSATRTTVNSFAFSAIQITGIFESFFAGSVGRNKVNYKYGGYSSSAPASQDIYTSIYAMSAFGTGYKIFVCGSNMHGKLGLGINNILHNEATWKQLPGTWKSASAGAFHFAAIDMSGNLWSCGLNNCNQLGVSNTSTLSSNQLIQITSGINFNKVVCGHNYTAVLQDTNLYFSGDAINRFSDSTFANTGFVNTLFEGSFDDIYNTNHGGGINLLALSSNYVLLNYGKDYYPSGNLLFSRQNFDYCAIGLGNSVSVTSQGFLKYNNNNSYKLPRKPVVVPVLHGCFLRRRTSNMNRVQTQGSFTRGLTANRYQRPSADGVLLDFYDLYSSNVNIRQFRLYYNDNDPGGTPINMYVYLDEENPSPFVNPMFKVTFNSNRLGTPFGFTYIYNTYYSRYGAPQADLVYFTGTFVDGNAVFDSWNYFTVHYSDYLYSVFVDRDLPKTAFPSDYLTENRFARTIIDGRNNPGLFLPNDPYSRLFRTIVFSDSNNKINYLLIPGTSSSIPQVKNGIWKQLEKPYTSVFNCGVNQYYIEPGRPVPPQPTSNPPVVTPTPLPVYPQPPLSKIAVTYKVTDADGSLRAVTFSDNGTGLNLNQSAEINFKDYFTTNQNTALTLNFEKNSTVSPQNSFNDLVRIRRRNNSIYTNMLKSVNSSTLISPFINIDSFRVYTQTAFLNILPYSSSAPQGTYILGFGDSLQSNMNGTYQEYKSTDKGNTWSFVKERLRTAFPAEERMTATVIIRNTNESYNGSTEYARLMQSEYEATGTGGGWNEPVFSGYIGRGYDNSAPGEAIRRTLSQDADLTYYLNHNFRYSNNDIPYVIIQNNVNEILLYSPNFTANGAQNKVNPWNQLFKFSDSNIPDRYAMESILGQFYKNANTISKMSIAFDRNDSNLLYYSYPLFKRNIGAGLWPKQDCGGIAVGTYNISTGVRTNRYAFRNAGTMGNNYSADVTSAYDDQKVNGHEFIIDNNNDVWLFILCDTYAANFFGTLVPITLYILKLNKTTGVWGLAKTLPLTQANNTINLLASIVYK